MTPNMNRRNFVIASASLAAAGGLGAGVSYANGKNQHKDENMNTNIDWKSITKSEWKTRLTEQEFYVMRKEGTERPGSSPLNNEKRAGTFNCAACGLPLFESVTKYESGTGWPSFWQPIKGNIETKRDFKMLVPRTEYHCARCGAHQGHVFKDGPKPTGLRYCNNGVALDFVPS
ncbi:MAG: peptide-methionine (R)-S-oxide reductase MsrB [Robiginitomaculum sp.]|nr:peptide-methionine (R)-S-oxide reductase MsrB [Robiginitomaculum sp.]